MRFMVLVKADKNSEAGIPPRPELMAGMGKLTEEMIKTGVLLASESTSTASVATNTCSQSASSRAW